jgi:hypothetical protein
MLGRTPDTGSLRDPHNPGYFQGERGYNSCYISHAGDDGFLKRNLRDRSAAAADRIRSWKTGLHFERQPRWRGSANGSRSLACSLAS